MNCKGKMKKKCYFYGNYIESLKKRLSEVNSLRKMFLKGEKVIKI